MKKLRLKVLGLVTALVSICAIAGATAYETVWKSHVYDFKLSVNVPRIYNNTESLGYRKFQRQTIKGEMLMHYNMFGQLIDVTFTNMVNKTHKLSNGKHVTYDAMLDIDKVYPRFNAIGNNKTEKFDTATLCFFLQAEPSYNIGEMNEDNGLYVLLSGKGKFASKTKYLKTANGYLTGTLGCGCMAYGHKSPTRQIGYFGPTEEVSDVAAVYGTWKMSLKK